MHSPDATSGPAHGACKPSQPGTCLLCSRRPARTSMIPAPWFPFICSSPCMAGQSCVSKLYCEPFEHGLAALPGPPPTHAVQQPLRVFTHSQQPLTLVTPTTPA